MPSAKFGGAKGPNGIRITPLAGRLPKMALTLRASKRCAHSARRLSAPWLSLIYPPFITRATGIALHAFPQINAR
jgi:hypothetical protein